ncbi:MBL fold metallo-hydrolase [Phreatobacter sp.]|uniref:MBL fold metallo-hydrolase n=1 Tax=Phreatobacter sp. TaxID=1966341 RepID=UPI003F6F228E
MTSSSASRLDFGRVSVFLGDKNGKYPDGNQVIVTGADTRAVFDTPISANRIGADFDTADLAILGHVHEDHMAGLHRLPGAAVHVPEADLAAARSWEGLAAAYGTREDRLPAMLDKFRRDFFYAPRPDAIPYADGAVWDLGGTRVTAIHMPGHTAGHSVLLIEPEGIACLGDIDLGGFGPYYGDASSSLADFRRTLARVADIPASVWVTFHHRGVYTDRTKLLADLAAYAAKLDERSDRLLAMLGEGPRSLGDLVATRLLYPPDHAEPWVDDVEALTIRRHLDELIAAGQVAVEDNGRFVRC